MSSNGQDMDLNDKILKQIEYYFGDVNLQRDKFLQDEMKKDHGWVPLDVLLTFNRLKQLSTDKSVIAASVKDSEVVDVSEDGEKVRRNPAVPIPENSLEFWQEVKTRTVYVKGFPPETTLDDIMEYLKPHGTVVNVVMRKLKETKVFKGSIFATFKDKESAENFAKNEDTKKYKDIEVTRMMQNDYWAKEIAENKERKAAEKALKNQMKNETRKKTDDAHSAVHFVKGQVMHVSGLPTENVGFSILKEFFNKYAPVAYAAYEQGSSEASLRFLSSEENAAVKAMEKMNEAAKESDGKILFQGQEIQCKVLDGEEEEKYWADFTKNKADKETRGYQHNNRRGRGNKRGGRGGGGNRNGGGRDFRNNKRRADDENSGEGGETEAKKPKTEAAEPKEEVKAEV
uniref:La protein n=1 Tax=Panagrolaimus sp. ES5 TaxID=591445 RepID=A0AC34FY77_9BILA